MSSRGRLFVISGPSGSGKTSLTNRLLEAVPGLRFSVSYTTRPKRKGEEHGKQYFFVSPEDFEDMVERNALLEHAHVYGNLYGTSREFVEIQQERGLDVLLDIDVQGALIVRQAAPEAVMIFVMPPSYAELRDRLIRRGLDDAQVIELRLQLARKEIQYYRRYDYLVINDDLVRSLEELKSIVVAGRCAMERRAAQAEAIVSTFE
ncbi:MAG TPA: guanylate kinase [Acidobacteriota bacterium]|nr:guanylate kinase [Acidobacteriota bacterium]